MANVKSIRALERGILVLKTLNDTGPVRLHDLHVKTDLAKPTLLRILKTLIETGMVRQGLGDSMYRNAFGLKALSDRMSIQDHLGDVAAPALDQIRRNIKWPCDLFMLDPENGEMMRLIETNRANSPFHFHIAQIGLNVNLAFSAVGRAYLASCPEEERQLLLKKIETSKNSFHIHASNLADFGSDFDQIREQGYALREKSFTGAENLENSVDDGMYAMAVPIKQSEKVLGCLNIVWLRASHDEEEFVKLHLEELQNAARETVERFTH